MERAVKQPLKMELEIAQLDQQIAGLKESLHWLGSSQPWSSSAPTIELPARLASQEPQSRKAKGFEARRDETERILKVNAIDDALQREMERWAKLL